MSARKNKLKRHHHAASILCRNWSVSTSIVDARAGNGRTRVVVVQTGWLEQVHRNSGPKVEVLASDSRSNNESNENDKDDEIKNGITDDSAFSQFGLLKRVDGRADLTAEKKLADERGIGRAKCLPRAQPEKHDGMELVNIRDEQDRQMDEENHVAEDEIGGKHAQLGNLAKEFTSGLRDGMPAHGIPFTSPPSNVGGVSLELSSERQGNDQLEKEPLDGSDGNHSRQRLCKAPARQEEHDLEEGEKHDNGNGVRDGSENGAKLLTAHAEERAHATRHSEHATKNTGIDSNGTESD